MSQKSARPSDKEIVSRAVKCGPAINFKTLYNFRRKKPSSLTTGEKVCYFAERYLTVPEGPMVGQKLKLDPFQVAFIQSVFDNKHGTRKAILSIGRRSGKALALDTPVATPHGFKPMGAIVDGDFILGSDGKAHRVLVAHPVMYERPCRKVTFSDGTSVIADSEHLWKVHRKTPKRGSQILQTDELRETLYPRPDGKTEYRWKIARPGIVDFDNQSILPIDPYVFGLWLAEGSHSNGYLWLGHKDADHLISQVRDAYPHCHVDLEERGTVRVRLNGQENARDGHVFINDLKTLGVFGDKHIPDCYLYASEQDRWRLLQGIFDGDGHVANASGQGKCEITFVSKLMTQQVAILLRSLGVKVSEPCTKIVNDKPYYRLNFTAYSDQPISTLSRHLERLCDRTKANGQTSSVSIVSIEDVPSVPVRCLTVDAPDSLYLVGHGLIPTHNTFCIAVILLAFIIGPVARVNTLVCSAALSRDQAALCFRLMHLMLMASPELDGLWRAIPSSKKIFGLRKNVEYNALSADAKKGHGRLIAVLLLDEAGQIVEPENDYISMLTSSQGNFDDAMMFIVSTQAPSDQAYLSIEIDNAIREQKEKTVCHVYCADSDCDVKDERQWYYAQPSLGKYRSLIDMREQIRDGISLPAKMPGVMNLLLNMRVAMTSLAISPQVWRENNRQPDLEVFRKAKLVSMGLDLSIINDLTAAVLTAVDDMGNIHVLTYAFTPLGGIEERTRAHKVPYAEWARQEVLYAPPGDTLNYDLICQYLAIQLEKNGIFVHQIHFDRYRMEAFRAAAERQNLCRGAEFRECGQGFVSMGPRIDAFETAMLERRFFHGAHPVLTLGASHAIVQMDAAGNRKYAKDKSGGAKIDGLIAMVMSAYPHCAPEFEKTIDIAALCG